MPVRSLISSIATRIAVRRARKLAKELCMQLRRCKSLEEELQLLREKGFRLVLDAWSMINERNPPVKDRCINMAIAENVPLVMATACILAHDKTMTTWIETLPVRERIALGMEIVVLKAVYDECRKSSG